MNLHPIVEVATRPIVQRVRLTFLLANLLLTAFTAKAQQPIERNVGDSLRSLSSRASVAFVGQVTRIECHAGIVDVTFAVEQQVLGGVGPIYHLRQWVGPWTGGQRPFHLGQRDLIFAHAPSTFGLASTVDGDDGIVPVLPAGNNRPAIADLRRLAVRVERAQGSPVAVATGEAMALPLATATVSAWKTGPVREPVLLQLTASNSGIPVAPLAPR